MHRSLTESPNCLLPIATHVRPFSPVSHKLMEPHWLPVKYRISFKLNVITYKFLSLNRSNFDLSSCTLLECEELCCASQHGLQNNSAGSKPFPFAAPTDRNKLPLNVRWLSRIWIWRKNSFIYKFIYLPHHSCLH